MITPEFIQDAIVSALDCDHIEVTGDGHHWNAVIVSPTFEGLPRVKQHQLVYKALGERMKSDIHALSMITLTPAEWDQLPKVV